MNKRDDVVEDDYRRAERLLWIYPKLKRQVDDYQFEPVEHDRSITVAPSRGGMRDRDEIIADRIKGRHMSYQITYAQFWRLYSVIRLYDGDERFKVIRMYYFGEDADGNAVNEQNTMEQIADALMRNERTVRKWRRTFVREIATLLFGLEVRNSTESVPF